MIGWILITLSCRFVRFSHCNFRGNLRLEGYTVRDRPLKPSSKQPAAATNKGTAATAFIGGVKTLI